MQLQEFSNPDWHRGTPNLRRRILRALLLDTLLLAVLILLGEVGVRLVFPETARMLYSRTLTGGYPVEHNSHGLRDHEFPAQRPPEEARVVCLGNSTTFGTGVAGADTYPKQLETLLNARSGAPRSLVINGGGQGTSVDQMLSFLQDKGLAFDPAVVVIGFSPSALGMTARALAAGPNPGTAAHDPPVAGRLTRLKRTVWEAAVAVHIQLSQSYLYAFCDAQIRRRFYRLGVMRDRMDKSAGAIFAYAFDVPGVDLAEIESVYATFAEQVSQVKAVLDRRGIPCVVLGMPSRFELSQEPEDNERGFELRRIRIQPLDRVAQLCAQLEIPYVDLRPPMRAARAAMLAGDEKWDDLYTPLDYTHLNRTGLHIAAEELLQCIDGHGWLRGGSEARYAGPPNRPLARGAVMPLDLTLDGGSVTGGISHTLRWRGKDSCVFVANAGDLRYAVACGRVWQLSTKAACPI
jgi:lysophospholipase L1-like esterase